MPPKKFVDSRSADIISRLVQDETGKRQYYRPVYSLHKWWARRPGALFRSIILLACNPDEDLFAMNANGSLSLHSNYFQDHNLENVVILDPFMGGGSTLVEANRIGAKVIGCDLNPVSFWIVRETLKPIDLGKLDRYFRNLESTAGEKIKSLYQTNCAYCNAQGEGLYVFWVRYVICPYCGEEAHLFKRSLLNQGLSRTKPPSLTNPATVFCPQCLSLNVWHGEESGSCQSCDYTFDPRLGTYKQGYYACLQCGSNKISLIETLQTGQKLREKLVAIEYWCECRNTRSYKSPDVMDLEKIAWVEQTVKELGERLVFPRQRILEGASSLRWRRHNYQFYHEIFNARQLLSFNYLIEAIQAIPEEEYRDAFVTVFSNSLEYNNMMTPYNYPHRKLHHLFNYHAMPLTTTPVENAVWGSGTEGAGTFTNCYQRYVRAKRYCHEPFDKFKDSQGAVQTVRTTDEKILSSFVSSFKELEKTQRSAFLLCGDSACLSSIPERSVDFVITDPPYFDSIHYSELSNFFYVWLRCLVDHQYFHAEHVPTEQEAIVNAGMNKGEEDYQKLLSAVFRECERVLKDDGKLIFTFHHTKWRAWWTIVMAVTKSGFRVADYFPVMSEYKVNPHIRNKQALDMDLVLICQKMSVPFESLSLLPEDILQRAISDLSLAELDNNDNKLFLYFMGELLRTTSSIQNSEEVSYHWFSEALAHFNIFLADLDRDEHIIQYEMPIDQQLRLFDTDAPANPDSDCL